MANPLLNIDDDYTGDRIQGQRDYQEDDFGFDNSKPNDFLMILADGMGGYEGGAIASSLAIKTFMDSYHAVSGPVAKRLQYALQKTNHQLALKKKSNPKLQKMGCTLVGVVIHDEQIEWISVGDSPLWLYNAGRLTRLNADHSMKPILHKQVQQGELTAEEAAKHPDRNMLRAAVTGETIALIDQSSEPLELYPDDRILLASDGLFTLSLPETGQILQQDLSATKLVHQLLNAVHKKGKPAQDNATALVVKMPHEMGTVKPRWRWQTGALLLGLILSLLLWIGVEYQAIDLLELMQIFR